MRKKLLVKDIIFEMDLFDYTIIDPDVLSSKYVLSKTKMKCTCPKGHLWETNWNNFKSGKRCPECRGTKKKTIDELNIKFNDFGYTLLSKKYKNNRQKLDYVCPNGHEGSTSWGNFNKGA